MKRFMKVVLFLVGFAMLSAMLAAFVPELDTSMLKEGAKVARINIEGAITSSGGGGLISGKSANSEKIIKRIKDAEENDDIKAILLRINSPGGGAVASREISEEVKEVDKLVVARIISQGTSGAYWIASASGTIVADPLSLVGSIGVTSSYLEFSGMFDKLGIEYVRLVSGKYKDIGSQYRNLTQVEREIMMEKIMKVDKMFKRSIKNNRNLTEEQFQKINSSLFYLGMEGKDLNLVDKLGGKEETEEVLKKELNVSKIKYKEYEESTNILDLLFSLPELRGLKAILPVSKFFQISYPGSFP